MAVNELRVLFAQRQLACDRCKQSGHCLVANLSPPAISKLSGGIGMGQTLRRGNHLYHAGDELKSIFIIQSGTIKSYSADDTGSETVLSLYLPTELMGFEAIETGTQTHSAVAIEASSYCAISYDRLMKASREDRDFQREIWRLSSHETRRYEEHLLLLLAHKSSREKVALSIVNLASRFWRIGYSAREFRLPFTRSEFGSYLGVTLETTSRILQKLQSEGILQVKGHNIRIMNYQALAEAAGIDSCGLLEAAAS